MKRVLWFILALLFVAACVAKEDIVPPPKDQTTQDTPEEKPKDEEKEDDEEVRSIPVVSCPSAASRQAKKPVPVPTSRMRRGFPSGIYLRNSASHLPRLPLSNSRRRCVSKPSAR